MMMTTDNQTTWDPITIALASAGTLLALGLSAYLAYLASTREERHKHQLLVERKKQLIKNQQEQELRKKTDSLTQGPKLIIYFGSQTGTAENFAKTIGEGSRGVGLKALVKDLDDFEEEAFADPATRNDNMYCFVVATYGEGDPSDNAVKFHTWLTENQDSGDLLTGLRYTVFGLGNKQYEHFNAMGRFVNATLEKMGATRIYKYGEGDDDARLENDFQTWSEDLYEELHANQFPNGKLERSGSIGEVIVAPEFLYESTIIPTPTQPTAMVTSQGRIHSTHAAAAGGGDNAKIDFSSKSYFRTIEYNVTNIKELRASKGTEGLGSTLHVELAVPPGTTYGTAHNLSIVPENDPIAVENVAKLLKLDPNAWIMIRPKKGVDPVPGPLFPVPCTVRTALACYCSINSVCGRNILAKLAHFAQNPEHKSRLLHLASKQGKAEFASWIQDRRMSFYELLLEFPSLEFPDPANFFEIVPRLMARDYTIASSCKANPKSIHLVVSVVTECLSPPDRFHRGVCTHALGRRFHGSEPYAPIYGFVKPSSFTLPSNPLTPIVMVGPGTGVAPMRALIQEREWQKSQGMRIGPAVLFFGCRRKDEDFIYESEMKQFEKTGVLTGLFVAFSRDGAKKVYVTNKIMEQEHLLWDLLSNKNGHFYLCGGTQMGRDVSAALEGIFDKMVGDGKGKGYLQKLVEEGRFTQELWS